MAKLDYSIIYERIKPKDFPVECLGMYCLCKVAHAHQVRKGSGLPYYIHPRGVAMIVKLCGGSNDQISAALGHDLLEDTEYSFADIATVANSVHVAELCSELRNNRHVIQEVGKTEYMTEKLLKMSEEALLIKLADMLYNSWDQPAEKAMNRMYKNVCELLLKRKINDKCRELAQLILLA